MARAVCSGLSSGSHGLVFQVRNEIETVDITFLKQLDDLLHRGHVGVAVTLDSNVGRLLEQGLVGLAGLQYPVDKLVVERVDGNAGLLRIQLFALFFVYVEV